MKRKIAALGLLICVLSLMLVFVPADADIPQHYDAEGIYELADPSILYVRALREDGTAKAAGTGVVISADGVVATAYHVIEGAERLEGVFNDGRTVRGIEVTAYDEQTDAAVLKLPVRMLENGEAEPYKPLAVRETAVKYGEKVFAVGYPLKNTPIITEGIINSPGAEINGRNRILTSAQIANGMSGGPIINRNGQLTGIISGSLRSMEGIHLVIPLSDVTGLLQIR
jgi:S1-C subfamily serine protease